MYTSSYVCLHIFWVRIDVWKWLYLCVFIQINDLSIHTHTYKVGRRQVINFYWLLYTSYTHSLYNTFNLINCHHWIKRIDRKIILLINKNVISSKCFLYYKFRDLLIHLPACVWTCVCIYIYICVCVYAHMGLQSQLLYMATHIKRFLEHMKMRLCLHKSIHIYTCIRIIYLYGQNSLCMCNIIYIQKYFIYDWCCCLYLYVEK